MVIIWMLIPFYDLFYLEIPSHAHEAKANHYLKTKKRYYSVIGWFLSVAGFQMNLLCFLRNCNDLCPHKLSTAGKKSGMF